METYIPLHVHSANGSVGDSILRIDDYVARAKEYGLDALTLTDHGSLSAMRSFADACIKNSIKPIIGMEAYETEDVSIKDSDHRNIYHLVLLAKNNEGLKNLIALHNLAATDGFYYRPRIDMKMLEKHGKGLIGLSGCIAGRIPQAVLENNMGEAFRLAKKYMEILDGFYLEIQPGNFADQVNVNDGLMQLSKSAGIPVVATNDIHYLDKEDAYAHNAHVLLGRNAYKEKSIAVSFDSKNYVYPDTCYWFMNRQDIIGSFTKTNWITEETVSIAIENAKKIAASCNTTIETSIQMPKFIKNNSKDENNELRKLCYEKLWQISQEKEDPSVYATRLERELDVISKKGFCGYFLIVKDYVDWARKNNIAVGPGRGSAAGSLVSYLLGISQADPIVHNLMFERFLDPNRDAIPDIDMDFSPGETGRDRVFDYIAEKYGRQNCALVSTIHTRKARGAIRDAARVLGYDTSIGDRIAKLIPTVHYTDDSEKVTDVSIDMAIEVVQELREMEMEYGDIFSLAKKIEGLPSSSSIHAAGILVSPKSLSKEIPLVRSNKDDMLATSLDLEDAEKSFVKFDILSVAHLDVIQKTEEALGFHFDWKDNKVYDNDAAWGLIGSKNTTGLFQIGSSVYKSRMPRLCPHSIDELAVCLALVRGPGISTGMDRKYMEALENYRKTGRKSVEWLCEEFNEPTKNTFGIPVFQEQVMEIFVNFGFSLSDGYRFIKAGAHKKAAVLKAYEQEFMEKAMARKVDEETAKTVFGILLSSSGYLFNRSHAVSYAMVCYATAFFKTIAPAKYMAAYLSGAYANGKQEAIEDAAKECRRLGIRLLPSDINSSGWECREENGAIRLGLETIKGMGKSTFEHISKFRPFTSIKDIETRAIGVKFNRRVVTACEKAGALDSLKEKEKKIVNAA